MWPDCGCTMAQLLAMLVYLCGKIEMIVTTNFRNRRFQNFSPHCTFGSFSVLNGVH